MLWFVTFWQSINNMDSDSKESVDLFSPFCLEKHWSDLYLLFLFIMRTVLDPPEWTPV